MSDSEGDEMTPLSRKFIRASKKAILKCLTEDFKHGRKKNQAIFDAREGFQCFNGTDLEMVMDKVVMGLYLAINEMEGKRKSYDVVTFGETK